MTLIKTSILSAIATIIKVINGFVLLKIVALYIGPSGLAIISQFQNFTSTLMTFATGAINGGVVKYTAEYNEDEKSKQKLWSTALRISVFSTFLVSLALALFPFQISKLIFKTHEYDSILLIFAATLLFFVLNSLLLAILNGQKEIKKLTVINIVSSFVGLFLTGGLVYFYGLYGALLSYTIGQSLVFFVTLIFVIKSSWFKKKLFTQKVDIDFSKKLSKYTAMAIVSALTLPVSQILIRNYIVDTLSWDDAGYWAGITRISDTYLMIITTSLGVYYLPRLSEIKDNSELRREIFYGYKILMPIVILMALIIYFLRDFIVLLLFTEKFKPMTELFFYQLLGDIFKMASWLLGYLMHAKAMAKLFITTEIMFSVSFIVLSIIFIQYHGLIGATMAFAVNYSIYLLIMIFVFRDVLHSKETVNE